MWLWAEVLEEDVRSQLDDAINSAPCTGLAVDQSFGISNNAQFLEFVRFYPAERNHSCEDF